MLKTAPPEVINPSAGSCTCCTCLLTVGLGWLEADAEGPGSSKGVTGMPAPAFTEVKAASAVGPNSPLRGVDGSEPTFQTTSCRSGSSPRDWCSRPQASQAAWMDRRSSAVSAAGKTISRCNLSAEKACRQQCDTGQHMLDIGGAILGCIHAICITMCTAERTA